jgi:hypothetical protein
MSDKFYCNDESRTNGLSLEPGGVTLTVTTRDGKSISYDKVKNHWAYARKVLKLQGDFVVSIMLGQTDLAKAIREGGKGKPPTPPEDKSDTLPF